LPSVLICAHLGDLKQGWEEGCEDRGVVGEEDRF